MHPPTDDTRDYAKYSTGNARTLRDHGGSLDVLKPCDQAVGEHQVCSSEHTAKAMKEFYDNYYSTAPMAVTLVGPQRYHHQSVNMLFTLF